MGAHVFSTESFKQLFTSLGTDFFKQIIEMFFSPFQATGNRHKYKSGNRIFVFVGDQNNALKDVFYHLNNWTVSTQMVFSIPF